MELIIWHLNYPRAHPLRYPCLSLVKYPKLLLSYHLGLGSYDLCLLIQRCIYYFHLLIYYCCIT